MSQIDETEINMPLNDSFEDLFKDADQPELVVDERQEVVPVRVERKMVDSCATMEAMARRASENEKKNVILTDELLAAMKQNHALIDQLVALITCPIFSCKSLAGDRRTSHDGHSRTLETSKYFLMQEQSGMLKL